MWLESPDSEFCMWIPVFPASFVDKIVIFLLSYLSIPVKWSNFLMVQIKRMAFQKSQHRIRVMLGPLCIFFTQFSLYHKADIIFPALYRSQRSCHEIRWMVHMNTVKKWQRFKFISVWLLILCLCLILYLHIFSPCIIFSQTEFHTDPLH